MKSLTTDLFLINLIEGLDFNIIFQDQKQQLRYQLFLYNLSKKIYQFYFPVYYSQPFKGQSMLTTSTLKLKTLNKSMELRSDSFKKDSPLHTPRISALNSVNKSVKYNDLSFITGQQLCKLRREPSLPSENIQFLMAKTNMSNVRQRYDKANQQKIYFENKIERLTEEKDKFIKIIKEAEQKKSQGNEKVKKLEQNLQLLKLKLAQKQFEKISAEQMIEVIKHDKIFYEKKRFDMEKQLRDLQIKLSSFSQQQIQQNEQEDKTLKVYEKLVSHLDKQTKERQQHINSLQFRIIQKQKINTSTILRQSQLSAIVMNTMGERSSEEKEWMRIFKANKLLQRILQSKIDREMEKFMDVQQAYKNVKIATGVNDAQTMVDKFLSKSQIYGDILSKIAQNQKQIEELKAKQQQYLKEMKKHEQHLSLLEASKGNDESLRDQMKQIEYYEAKKRNCDFKEKKLKQFLSKQFGLFTKNGVFSDSDKIQLQYSSRTQSKQSLINYLKNLSSIIEQSVQLQETKKTDIEQELATPEGDAKSKIFRIKPHIPVKIYQNQEKQLIKEQFIENFEEEEITNANDEAQVVEEHRSSLFKSNYKFMKQLKNKKQEEKRLVIEALMRNNKEKAAPITKKVQNVQQ